MGRTDKKIITALQIQLLACRKALDEAEGMLEKLIDRSEAPAPRQRRNLRNGRIADISLQFNKYNK